MEIVDAYERKPNAGTRARRIWDALKEHGPLRVKRISELTNIDRHGVNQVFASDTLPSNGHFKRIAYGTWAIK